MGPLIELALPLAAGAALAAFATARLVRCAGRLGLLDAAVGADAHRKKQVRAVPAVGGVALLCAWFPVALIVPSAATGLGAWASPWTSPQRALLAISANFVVGLIDDRRAGGLPPALKVVLQLAALAPLYVLAPAGMPGTGADALWIALALVVGLNAFNVFDNSDGAAASLGAVALAVPAPLASAALLGFLPFNLSSARPASCTGTERSPMKRAAATRARAEDAPRAYLGNAGSHALGTALLVFPHAWPALVLPLLDALRVAWERVRAGEPPWRGDRRHLAHRLERGASPGARRAGVLLGLGSAFLPALALGWMGRPLLGAAASAGIYVVLVFATRSPRERRTGAVQ